MNFTIQPFANPRTGTKKSQLPRSKSQTPNGGGSPVDRFLPDADDELRNALHVSFLEHLDFIGPRGAQAWKLMTPRLQSAWKDIITDNEKLHGRPWPQGKVKPWLAKPESESKPTSAQKDAEGCTSPPRLRDGVRPSERADSPRGFAVACRADRGGT